MEPRAVVESFAKEMEKQLRANEYKGGWEDCTARHLLDELQRNYIAIISAFLNNDCDGDITRRCANVANFAMMIADNFGSGLGE